MNINDPRSLTGTYSRGKNVYNGASRAPNPRGKNQYLSKLAKIRRINMAKRSNNGMV